MSETYTQTFLEISESAHEKGHHFHITTMTCLFRVHCKIDIAKLYNIYQEDGVTLRLSKNTKDYYRTKRNKVTKVFYNQISFIFSDYSKKSIKLFSNGNVQITGLASLHDFQCTKELVLEWLNKYTDVEYDVIPGTEKIAMLNAHYTVSDYIKLKPFIEKAKQNEHVLRVRYKPESYPAINVKMKNNTSVFVFRTGNIIMSTNSIEAIKTTYHQLGFEDNSLATKVYPTKSVLHGYDLKAFTNCIY